MDVPAGSALYLPARWWHCVAQRPPDGGAACVSANWWHDFAYDARYAGGRLEDALAAVAGGGEWEESEGSDA